VNGECKGKNKDQQFKKKREQATIRIYPFEFFGKSEIIFKDFPDKYKKHKRNRYEYRNNQFSFGRISCYKPA
jgi:hypothetical protein